MITYKLKKPMTVGDMKNQIMVDELVVKSLSISFLAKEPVVSVVFLHPASGWQHNVCYGAWNTAEEVKDQVHEASDIVWTQVDAELKKVIDALVQLMIAHGHVPPVDRQQAESQD